MVAFNSFSLENWPIFYILNGEPIHNYNQVKSRNIVERVVPDKSCKEERSLSGFWRIYEGNYNNLSIVPVLEYFRIFVLMSNTWCVMFSKSCWCVSVTHSCSMWKHSPARVNCWNQNKSKMNTVQGGTGGYSNSGKKGNIDLWEVRLFSNDILIRLGAVYLIMEG